MFFVSHRGKRPRIAITSRVDVTAYGAVGDGVTDDSVAVRNAAAALTPGAELWFPAGTYLLDRHSTFAYCVNIGGLAGFSISGVKGKSWLKLKPGQPATSVSLLRLDSCSDVNLTNLGFDGNWGAVIGSTDSQAGINHSTQADPQSHGLSLRGVSRVYVADCTFTQIYGDCVWIGTASTDFSQYTDGVAIYNCEGSVSARNGISLAQWIKNVHVQDCTFNNPFTTAFDVEPVDQPVEHVKILQTHLGSWWNAANPSRTVNSALSIEGGTSLRPSPLALARDFTVSHCTVDGAILLLTAKDVTIKKSVIRCEWDGYSYSPIWINGYNDNITIDSCTVYDRTTNPDGAHNGSIGIQYYASGSVNLQPKNVLIKNTRIYSQNGNKGVVISGTGGPSYGTGSQPSYTADVTFPSINTVVLPGTWPTNYWQGRTVTAGRLQATVSTNTSTTLTLFSQAGSGTIWANPDLSPAGIPAAQTVTLSDTTGVVTVQDTVIDCSDRGYGAGGQGIYVYTSRAGVRAVLKRNTVKNATGYAIALQGIDSARAVALLQLVSNAVQDTRAVPLTTVAIQFNTQAYLLPVFLQNNSCSIQGVPLVSGLSGDFGAYQESGIWVGAGAPQFTAVAGDTYLDQNTNQRYLNIASSAFWQPL